MINAFEKSANFHFKIFLSETTRLRALIFGMDLYQVCSNYAIGAKTESAVWIRVLHIRLV